MFAWPFLSRGPLAGLNKFEQKIYSENGEDGILKAIFKKLGSTDRYCVEFGVGDGTVCNTRYLIEKRRWKFLQMDQKSRARASVRREIITAENINYLFLKHGVPREFDLLSVDLDYNTYWVWKAIEGFSPRVVVIEYNGNFPPDRNFVVPYDPLATWERQSSYYGASLLALVKLGASKGYALVGCDSTGVNAFFIRNDLVKGNFVVRETKEVYKRLWYRQKSSQKRWVTDDLGTGYDSKFPKQDDGLRQII
jgi:hypothetical protein